MGRWKGACECALTSLRFCCAANVVTAGEAREPDVYRDSSNRVLDRPRLQVGNSRKSADELHDVVVVPCRRPPVTKHHRTLLV